jgi:hypothetical protein
VPYPGDELVADAPIVLDRRLRFAAPRERVWPWLVQLHDAPDGGTLLHIRLRLAPSSARTVRMVALAGGAMDWLTIVGLRRGLAERLRRG